MDILTFAVSTPEPSVLTRTLTLKSTTRFTATNIFTILPRALLYRCAICDRPLRMRRRRTLLHKQIGIQRGARCHGIVLEIRYAFGAQHFLVDVEIAGRLAAVAPDNYPCRIRHNLRLAAGLEDRFREVYLDGS